MRKRDNGADRGFTLLEIALAMAILSVVALYTLDMYQSVRSRKRLVDDRTRIEQICSALKVYYSGHEALPGAGTSFPDSVPFDQLGLGQEFRFDTHGRPYRYYAAAGAAGFQVDGMAAAGVVISLGENQLQEYTSAGSGTGTVYTTAGDDILVPVEVNSEAVAIALAELESLGKAVESYNREYAGVQNNKPNPNFSLYGEKDLGAPPVIDPDCYNADWEKWSNLYPYRGTNDDQGAYFDYPGNYLSSVKLQNGLPPDDYHLAYDQPDVNWPPNDPPGADIYLNWPTLPGPPTPPTGPDLPPGFAGWSAPGPDYPVWPFVDQCPDPTGPFGEYLPPTDVSSYRLIDEGGCHFSTDPWADPNCVFAVLDASADPVGDIVGRYVLGSRFLTDPWGSTYLWGGGLANSDPRYHLFYSAGPDGTAGTDDDVILY